MAAADEHPATGRFDKLDIRPKIRAEVHRAQDRFFALRHDVHQIERRHPGMAKHSPHRRIQLLRRGVRPQHACLIGAHDAIEAGIMTPGEYAGDRSGKRMAHGGGQPAAQRHP